MIKRQQIPDILEESLKELLKTMPLKKITVQNIVDNCELTRTTFYRYFKDKYELTNWIYYNKIQTFLDANSSMTNLEECFKYATSVIYENANFFSAIITYEDQNSFRDFLYKYCSDYGISIIKKNTGTSELSAEDSAAVIIYFSGITQLLIHWIHSGCKESPDFIAKIMSECVPPPLSKYWF